MADEERLSLRADADRVAENESLGVLLSDAVRGVEHDYTRVSISRAVFLLAVPMMLEMAMESVFAVVDIFFVARLGAEAVATVGLTEAVITVLYAVAIGLSMGATAMVARRIGEKDLASAGVVAGQAIWIGLVVSAITGVLGITFAVEILSLMGAESGVIESGAGYASILLGGSVTIVFLFLLNAIFRGAGDPALAMRALWIANAINIFGVGPFPEMGVAGAATATTIGRFIGVIYQVKCLTAGPGTVRLSAADLALRWPVTLGLMRVSFGGVLQFFISTSSWILLMRIVAPYGASATLRRRWSGRISARDCPNAPNTPYGVPACSM